MVNKVGIVFLGGCEFFSDCRSLRSWCVSLHMISSIPHAFQELSKVHIPECERSERHYGYEKNQIERTTKLQLGILCFFLPELREKFYTTLKSFSDYINNKYRYSDKHYKVEEFISSLDAHVSDAESYDFMFTGSRKNAKRIKISDFGAHVSGSWQEFKIKIVSEMKSQKPDREEISKFLTLFAKGITKALKDNLEEVESKMLALRVVSDSIEF